MEQLAAEPVEGPALVEPVAVLQPLQGGGDGAARRHQQAGDAEPGGERQQVARQRQLLGDAAVDHQVDQREADDAEQQGQRPGDRVAGDDLDVPQLVAQDGVGESQRHQGQGHDRDRGQQLGHVQPEGVRQVIEDQDRQVAAGHAPRDPLHLAVWLPRRAAPEAPDEERQRGGRQDDEVEQLDAIERLDPCRGQAAEDPAPAGQHQVELERQQGRCRQVEERHQMAPAAGLPQRRREHQEQVERQGRQQDHGDRVANGDRGEAEVHRRRGGEQVEGRRGQAPEIEQQALAAAVAQQREEADRQIDGADQAEDQKRDVDVERRAVVLDLNDLLPTQDGQLARRPLLQALGEPFETGNLEDLVSREESCPSLLSFLSLSWALDRDDLEHPAPGDRLEAERLERLNLTVDAQAAQADREECEHQGNGQSENSCPRHERNESVLRFSRAR